MRTEILQLYRNQAEIKMKALVAEKKFKKKIHFNGNFEEFIFLDIFLSVLF